MRRPRASLVLSLLCVGLGCQGRAPTGVAPPPPPPPAPAATFADVPMAEHAEDVADYTLVAKLDPDAHTVHGEGTIRWKNVSRAPVSELWLHLYLNAFKNQSSVFLREPVGGFRGSTVPSQWGTIDVRRLAWKDGAAVHDLWSKVELRRPNDDDETDARVPLPRPIGPGETVTLDVTWDDKLPSVVERTGFDGSFHMVAQWFPKIAKIEENGTFAHFPFHHLGEFYADYGTYDVTIDVPSNYLVGASGPVVETRTENGRTIERHVQGDVHDFAFTAWDRFETRSETIDGVAVRILFPAGSGADAERQLASMRFALPHFGARFGKYPYGVLTIVDPPSTAQEAGGMEYPTLITTGGSPMVPSGVRMMELTTIHEFGHQYFYGLLASHETEWPFLDEGLNTYAEGNCASALYGPGSLVSIFGLRVADLEGHAERARHYGHEERVAQPAYGFDTGNQYGSLVYSRTGAILETFRRALGDAAMDRTLGVYARRFRFKHPQPDDLVATFRAELGDAAADTLRRALFDKGWTDLTVTQMSSHPTRAPAGLFDVAGKRETVLTDKVTEGRFDGWALVTRRGNLSFPTEIELVADDGTRTRVPWDGKAESIRVPYAGASPLRSAVVDPDHRILLDERPENNFATAANQKSGGARRTLDRTTYWAELLLGAVAP